MTRGQARMRGTTLRSGRELHTTNPTEGIPTARSSSSSSKSTQPMDNFSLRPGAKSPTKPTNQIYADDPDPLDETSSEQDREKHEQALKAYSLEMFEAYGRTNMRGNIFWKDFITAFRPHTMKSWSRATMTEWRSLLINRGIYVNLEGPIIDSLIEVLQRTEHINVRQNPGTATIREDSPTPEDPTTALTNESEGGNDQRTTKHKEPQSNQEETARLHPTESGEPDDPDDESSDDEDDYLPEGEKSLGQGEKDPGYRREPYGTYKTGTTTARPLGLNGLLKAFTGQTKFSGAYEEDLEDIISTFETYAEMCQVSSVEKRAAIPIMLKGTALSTFTSQAKGTSTYDEAKHMLRDWFSSSEKQSRLLRDWQGYRLTQDLERSPELSEIAVFKTFVSKLMRTQKQLHEEYHSDRQLRDQLLTAIDIPDVQNALRDRVPRTSQQLINRAANRMSEKPRTAGAMIADTYGEDAEVEEALYSLGQRYGGQARRTLKGFGGRQYPRRPGTTQRRISPQWMRGVKGCFVCGKDHRANEKHKREEVTAAVRKLKAKHPSAWLTVEDLAYITEIYSIEEETNQGEEVREWESEEEDKEDDEITYLADSDIREMETHLSNATFVHSLTTNNNRQETIKEAHYQLTNPTRSKFEGVRLDTCANRTSVMSADQYSAYCGEFGIMEAIRPNNGTEIRGIGGKTKTMGSAEIQIPFKDLGISIDVTFALMPGPRTPSLLSMRDMKDNGLEISIQREQVMFLDRSQKLKFSNYFLIHTWKPADVSYALYTEKELRRIHRTFGHPSVAATTGMLKRANEEGLDTETRKTIKEIAEGCKICNEQKAAPRRFKLTVGTDDLRFNHMVEVDTMFIDSKPILHMIDKATHFSAAAFLKTQSSSEIWKMIQQLWIYTYIGPPDYLSVDQGSAYVSKEIKKNLEANGVKLKQAPVENPGAIGTVERYHAPLRTAYKKIRKNTPRETTDKECLKIAVYAVNATTGPEGLCPMLLVFGAMPRPARTTPSLTQLQRAETIEAAMQEVAKEQAKRRIAFGLKHFKGPKRTEDKNKLRNLPPGSPVWVYRTRSKSWEGPHRIVSLEGETAIIQTTNGRSIFRTTCIRPATHQNQDEDEAMLVRRGGGRKSKGQQQADAIEFSTSRAEELRGLLKNGTFKVVKESSVPKDTRIYGSRFVDQIKKMGTERSKKSRLVAQNYADEESTVLSTSAPTIQRFTQRLIISIITSTPNLKPFVRDITQAYIQSQSKLERAIFIRAPSEMNLPENHLLQVIKPLYGIPESGLHWYLTYLDHHLQHLKMEKATMDPCLLIKKKNETLQGLVAIQVDDTLGAGTTSFLEDEEKASKRFKTKARNQITTDITTFNGINITRENTNTMKITQQDKIDGLSIPTTDETFASERAKVQYIGVNCRPDICAAVQLIAPTQADTPDSAYKSIKKTIQHLKDTHEIGLTYVKLNMQAIRLVVITDASFANAEGMKSQLGYVILLADDNRCNIIHYGSNRCRRVTRSVMAAELHALILGFDFAFAIRNLLKDIIGREVRIEAYVDSKTVFDVVAKDGRTAERRLQIDVSGLRESYEKGELAKIGWLPGTKNPADALTKERTTLTSALWDVMTTNRIDLTPKGWSTTAKVCLTKEKKEPQVSNESI